MTRARIAGVMFVTAFVALVLALVVRDPALERDDEPGASDPPAIAPAAEAATEGRQGFLYGRLTGVDGGTYEGRLRWGGDQEAFWGDYFNGAKNENPWEVHAPYEWRSPLEIFGIEIGDSPVNLSRGFLARFGDITRIEARFADAQVTLKSGTVFTLDRFSAGDIDDGVRVWDGRRGVVDLDARQIRTIAFRPAAPLAAAPTRLHGTVRTRQGDFTGFIQWNQQDSVADDALDGRDAGRDLSLPYYTIRSITRHSRDSAVVTLVDGREIVLSDREIGRTNRGIYVDEGRYGRALISWDAFERVEFTSGGSGPAYGDFAPGRPLAGSVTTRDGRRLAGRLVYDFDESETTETLDGLSQGVDYNIPFALIASIVPPGHDGDGAQRARVILHDGEALQLERSGDLRDGNAGMLIFIDGRERPEYVPWTNVGRIDLDRPPSGHR